VAFSADRRWCAYSLGDRPIHVRRIGDRTDFATVYGLETSHSQVHDFDMTLAIDSDSRRVAAATFISDGGPDHQGAYEPHLVVLGFDGRVLVSRRDLPADRLTFTTRGATLVTQSAGWIEDTPWVAGVVTIANATAAVQTARVECTSFTTAAAWRLHPCALATAALGPPTTPSLVANPNGTIVQLALPSLKKMHEWPLHIPGLPSYVRSPIALSPDGRAVLSLGKSIRILRDGSLLAAPFDLGDDDRFSYDFGDRSLAVGAWVIEADNRPAYEIELYSAATGRLAGRSTVPEVPVTGAGYLKVWTAPAPTTLYAATEHGIDAWSASPP
jgi:hypothetical protein